MKHYKPYIKPYLSAFLLGPLLMITEVLGEIMLPKMMSLIINHGVAQRDTRYILWMGIAMAFLALVMALGGIGGAYFSAKASICFTSDLRQDLFAKVQKFSFKNIDDFSAVAADHLRQDTLAGMEHPSQIDREHPFPFGRGNIVEQLLLSDSSVIDQHINAAEPLFNSIHHSPHLDTVRDICAKDLCILTKRSDTSSDLDRPESVCAVIDRHLVSLLRKKHRSRSPNPAGAASNQYRFRHPDSSISCDRTIREKICQG